VNVKTGQTGRKLGAPSLVASNASRTTNYQTGRVPGGGKAPFAEMVEAYMAWAVLWGARGQGVRDLRSPAMRLLRWLEGQGLTVADLDRRVARSYRASLVEATTETTSTLSLRTVSGYLQAARRVGSWLVDTGVIPSNPFVKLKTPRVPKTVLRQVPKEAQMGRLLEALESWESEGSDPRRQGRRYLAHVMAELQYATGLRICEVAALEMSDIDLEKRLVTVRDGKAGRSRYAWLTEYAAGVLEVYLTQMRPLVLTAKQGHNSHLVFGAAHGSLGRVQNRWLEKVGQEVGVGITSHSFRHALGYHLLRSGCPLRHIQEILGHANIKDTEVYTKVDVPEVQQVIDTCHPRGIMSLGHGT